MSKDTDQVVSLERKFWTDGNDPTFFQEAMADKGIAVIAVKRSGRWQLALTVHQPWKPEGTKGS